jgi:hypothetical protein
LSDPHHSFISVNKAEIEKFIYDRLDFQGILIKFLHPGDRIGFDYIIDT